MVVPTCENIDSGSYHVADAEKGDVDGGEASSQLRVQVPVRNVLQAKDPFSKRREPHFSASEYRECRTTYTADCMTSEKGDVEGGESEFIRGRGLRQFQEWGLQDFFQGTLFNKGSEIGFDFDESIKINFSEPLDKFELH